MERTQPLVVGPAAPEFYKITYNVDYIGGVENFIDGFGGFFLDNGCFWIVKLPNPQLLGKSQTLHGGKEDRGIRGGKKT